MNGNGRETRSSIESKTIDRILARQDKHEDKLDELPNKYMSKEDGMMIRREVSDLGRKVDDNTWRLAKIFGGITAIGVAAGFVLQKIFT